MANVIAIVIAAIVAVLTGHRVLNGIKKAVDDVQDHQR